MDSVSFPTSAGSTAGNIASSWLRPSLRYGSVSTMPLARSAFATAGASIASSKSMVPMTCERSAGSVTYGVVYDVFSAQEYRIDGRLGGALDAPVQAAVGVEPVDLLGHQEDRGESGVLYVWSRREFSIAVIRS